jgi:trk system potassium uptake protein TrkH
MIVRQATTLALYFVGLLFAFTITLTVLSDAELIDVLFEAMSAFGTVGFSAAGTSSFSGAAQFVLMVAMVTGRFSPLILVLYMTKARQQDRYHYPDDSVRLG